MNLEPDYRTKTSTTEKRKLPQKAGEIFESYEWFTSPYQMDYTNGLRMGRANHYLIVDRQDGPVSSWIPGSGSEAYKVQTEMAKKFDYCYVLAQESLKNWHYAQEESERMYRSAKEYQDEYIYRNREEWYKLFRFNEYGNTVQFRNGAFLLFVLGWLGAIGAGLSHYGAYRKTFQERFGTDTAEGISALKEEWGKAAAQAMEEAKKDATKARTAALKQEKEFAAALKKTESERNEWENRSKKKDASIAELERRKHQLEQEKAGLEKSVEELETCAATNGKIAAEVGRILECGDELSAVLQKMEKLRQMSEGEGGVDRFVSFAQGEITERMEKNNRTILRLSGTYMNEAYSAYFVYPLSLKRECEAAYEDRRYRKAFEYALRCEAACEFLESLFQQAGTTSDSNDGNPQSAWAAYRNQFGAALEQMGAIDSATGHLFDFFAEFEIPVSLEWNTEFIERIKTAHRKLAQKWHPDKHPNDPGANDRLARINRIRDTLNDKARFETYANAYRAFFQA